MALVSYDNFYNQRKLYPKGKLRNRSNTLKFNEIITSKNKYDLQTLCTFLVIIYKGVYTELLSTCTYIV